jgi:selenium metabolism protein YedF
MEPDIDCTGLLCPEPVIRTKSRLENEPGPFTVMVDNETARDNVSRFARTMGCEVGVEATDGGWLVSVTPSRAAGTVVQAAPDGEVPSARQTVFLLTGDEIGKGEPELGRTLMKMFLFAAAESDTPPATLILMNSAVRLVTENEETAASVKRLEQAGTEVLVCGTCLDYYGLKEALKVGTISNIYEIQGKLIGASPLVSL